MNEDKTLNDEKFREHWKSPNFKGNIDNIISKCLDINKLNFSELFVLIIIKLDNTLFLKICKFKKWILILIIFSDNNDECSIGIEFMKCYYKEKDIQIP